LNNHRSNNNRRRGRGGNRQQGGQQLNRIDSRARGNAQQLLDKYKKLAHDSHLNGDRVQEEYNLQFADHYFRVLADQKQRQEESRIKRDERPQDGSDADKRGDARGSDHDQPEDTRPARDGRSKPNGDAAPSSEGDAPIYEPEENPFVRDARESQASKPRKPRRKPREDAADDNGGDSEADADEPSSGVDPAVLPPSIGAASADDEDTQGTAEAKAEAKPRRRTRKPKPASDSDEPVEVAS